ncbi:MAG: single-stranded DNA-binding protein [Bacteroidales bacterium]
MVNKVILVGNVGQEPEVRHLDNNVSVASFSLATSETYSKDNERVTTTEWHNIVAWRALADITEKYIHKGSQLYIEGRLRNRSYDDKDGVKKYRTEIFADTIRLLGKKEDNNSSGGYSAASSPASQPQQASEDKTTVYNESNDNDDSPF